MLNGNHKHLSPDHSHMRYRNEKTGDKHNSTIIIIIIDNNNKNDGTKPILVSEILNLTNWIFVAQLLLCGVIID